MPPSHGVCTTPPEFSGVMTAVGGQSSLRMAPWWSKKAGWASREEQVTLPWLLLPLIPRLVSVKGKDYVSGCVSLSCPCCSGSWFLTTATETKLGLGPRLVSSSQQILLLWFLLSSDPLLLDFWTVALWKNVSIVLNIRLRGLTTVNCSH